MFRSKLMLRTLLLLAAMTATHADAAIPIKLVGFDNMSCSAWSDSKSDAEQRATFVAWVSGVLSGHNYVNRRQQVSSISEGTVERYVDRYCKTNPRGEFSDAAFRLSDQFSGRNEAITK